MSIRRFRRVVVAGVLGLVALGVGCETRQSPLTYLPANPAGASSGPPISTPLSVTRLDPTEGFPSLIFVRAYLTETKGARTGAFTFAAPAPGEYEFRYLLDEDLDVGRTQKITVQ